MSNDKTATQNNDFEESSPKFMRAAIRADTEIIDAGLYNRMMAKNALDTTPSKASPVMILKSSSETWLKNLTIKELEQFPALAHIDRNSRDIQGKDASVIVSAILNYLRLNSIQVNYEEDDPGKFRCKTFDFVSFHINMFAHDKEGGMEPSILVEIQRRSGCSLSFQNVRRSLLSTIDDITQLDTDTIPRRASISHTTRCIDSCLNCFEGIPIQMKCEDCETIATDALNEIQNHLKSDRTDAQVLALELLAHLTNPMHTPAKIVQVAAFKLLQSQEITDSIKSLILQGQDRSKAFESLDLDLQYEVDFVDNARQLALGILLNCFKAVSDQIPSILSHSGGWMVEKVLPCLLNNLREVEKNVHIALQSIKALTILSANSTECRGFIVHNKIDEVLVHVINYGAEWHDEIKKEAESLRSKI